MPHYRLASCKVSIGYTGIVTTPVASSCQYTFKLVQMIYMFLITRI